MVKGKPRFQLIGHVVLLVQVIPQDLAAVQAGQDIRGKVFFQCFFLDVAVTAHIVEHQGFGPIQGNGIRHGFDTSPLADTLLFDHEKAQGIGQAA